MIIKKITKAKIIVTKLSYLAIRVISSRACPIALETLCLLLYAVWNLKLQVLVFNLDIW